MAAIIFPTDPTRLNYATVPWTDAMGKKWTYEAAKNRWNPFLQGTSGGTGGTGSGDALTTQPLSQFAATTSAQLAGVISNETGSGALVFATSPTLVTPILGTPTSGNLANCTFPTLNQNTTGSAGSAPAGMLTGTTLASGVITSSLTTVGTIGTGVWQGTAVADSYIASATTWNAKQAALVSGSNIKTINGATILGSGDLTVTGTGGVVVQDEGSELATAGTTLNFVGAGVTASGTTGTKTITIPGGAGLADGDYGDITVGGTGTTFTIDSGVVTLAKMANLAQDSIISRVSTGAGVPEAVTVAEQTIVGRITGGHVDDLSASQVRTLLNVADGATANAGTVTTVSVATANGVSGSVANATTTPAITLTLGTIVPTTVNGLTLTAATTGFTVAGGTTSKTLTITGDVTITGALGTASYATLGTGAGQVPITGDYATAGYIPTAITAANEASDTTCFPAFFTAATGNLGPKTSSDFTFNSSDSSLFTKIISANALNQVDTVNSKSVGIISAGRLTDNRSHYRPDGTGTYALTGRSDGKVLETIVIACSDETTALTTGTAKVTFRMPYAMTLTDIKASVTTAPTGAPLIVDVNDGGTTIMTTDKLQIEATEFTTEGATTQPALTDTALAADAEITIDIDQIGSTIAGKGLKVTLIGYQT